MLPHVEPGIKIAAQMSPEPTEDDLKWVKQMGVEIVDSIDALLSRVDVVLLETNDGRLHLEQARKVFAAGKPVFIDKPVSASLKDAVAIYTEAQRAGVESQRYANASLKNAEVVHALGMWARIRDRWLERQKRLLQQQAVASDNAGNGSAMSKFVMMAASSLTLGLGALLTLEGKLDPMGSAMFLAWILSGKALQAPQQLISQWRQVVLFRDTLARLRQFLAQAIELVRDGQANNVVVLVAQAARFAGTVVNARAPP